MIKSGVKLNGIKPEIVIAYVIAKGIYEKHGADCVITEATGGKHGRASLHYVGLAIDLRTRDFTNQETSDVRDEIASALGSEYDVVLEKTHCHIEFQPK